MKIGCVIPAAGFSRRFGAGDKLIARIDGTAMIRRVCEAVVASRVAVCFVVVRPGATDIAATLLGLPITMVENSEAHAGMASSIAAGIAALDPAVSGAFVLPGDMPFMRADFIDDLIDRFESEGGNKVIVPVTPEGEQRNPVLWPSVHFPRLKELEGEGGAKSLLESLAGELVRVEAGDIQLFADIDTLQDLADQSSVWKRH